MTFSGLLSKSIKHHAANNTSSTAAASTSQKPVSTNATVATTTVTTTAATAPQEHVHNHTQGTDLVSPNIHDTPDPVLSMAMASSSPSTQPRSASIDPAALSIDPPSSSPSQLQMLSSQPTATVSKLDMKQPPTPLSPPSTTPSSPAATGVFTAITKKKSFLHQQQQQQQEQTLSPAQSASYRKRLNVNQVCDWCRYRKIRCDRESPCNSCQHSKRECIRTPPEVLLSKLSKEAEDSSSSSADSTATSTTTVRANKRSSPTDDQESQSSSLKANKIARSNSIAHSLLGVSVEHNTINSTCSLSPTVMGPLSLSLPSTTGLSHCGEKQQPQKQQSKAMLASRIQGTPTPTSLQDQEHLERMRRIEMLLSNVIPGAAEFIAHGHQRNSGGLSTAAPSDLGLEKQQQQQQQRQQQQQHTLSHISPVLTAAGSSLGLKPIQGEKSDSPSSLSPIIQADGNRSLGVGEGQNQGRRLSVFGGQEYIERMKRIELLLGSVQDNHNNNSSTPMTKLSLAVPSVASLNVDTNDEVKKESATATRKIKATGSKKVARNSDGTIIKRPHVAAGFAGQKPPPKLPQAIAEAAMKKLVGKKKKRIAAASNNASAATPKPTAVAPSTPCAPPIAVPVDVAAGAPASPASSTTSALAQTPIALELPAGVQSKAESPAPVTLSSPKSFDIPSTIDHHHHNFAQQQLQQQKDRAQSLARQQQPGPGHLNTQLQGSVSYHHNHHIHHHPHHKHHHFQNAPCASSTQASSAFMGGFSHQHSQAGRMTSIGSISIPTIPLSNTMASYESLVVPAYTSAESSPASSPKATATTIELPISIHSSSLAATVPVGSTMDFLSYESSSYSPFSAGVGLEGGADFAVALNTIHSGSSDHHHQLTTSIDGTTHTHNTNNNNNSQILLPFATHPTALMYSHHPHHLQQQQQQQSHHALHIAQDTHPMSLSSSGMPNFSGLQMTESLESWMSSQLVAPAPSSLDEGFLSSTDIITSTATVLPLVAHHSHGSPISPLPVSSSAFLTGGGRGGFGQLQHPQMHQHRSSIQHQHQQSFYIPQMLDDEDDGAENVNNE